MKKLLISFIFLALVGISFGQVTQEGSNPAFTNPLTQPFTKVVVYPTVKVICYTIPISLAKATTNYSDYFSLGGYVVPDSTRFIAVTWQSNDTCQATISLSTKNAEINGTVTQGTWNNFYTLVTNQLNAGNDTLYTKYIQTRGSVASGVTDVGVSTGNFGDVGRIKVVFGNPTTVGNSGFLRIWVYLRKV